MAAASNKLITPKGKKWKSWRSRLRRKEGLVCFVEALIQPVWRQRHPAEAQDTDIVKGATTRRATRFYVGRFELENFNLAATAAWACLGRGKLGSFRFWGGSGQRPILSFLFHETSTNQEPGFLVFWSFFPLPPSPSTLSARLHPRLKRIWTVRHRLYTIPSKRLRPVLIGPRFGFWVCATSEDLRILEICTLWKGAVDYVESAFAALGSVA